VGFAMNRLSRRDSLFIAKPTLDRRTGSGKEPRLRAPLPPFHQQAVGRVLQHDTETLRQWFLLHVPDLEHIRLVAGAGDVFIAGDQFVDQLEIERALPEPAFPGRDALDV